MKNILFIFLITIGLNSFGQVNTSNAIASCCDIGGRCTGSAYCSACTNCSGCKYCSKNGGSCGVCSIGNTRSYKSRKKRKKYNTKATYKKAKTISNLTSNAYLYTSSATLNLRNGPSTKHKIIIKLKKNTKLLYIKKQGNWIKVKVVTSKLIGYVHYKYIIY